MRIGIDLGGTKTEIVVLKDDGQEILRHRMPSAQGNYQNTLHTIRNLVTLAEEKINTVCPVGIGIPGSISPHTNLVRNANSTWLIGHPFQADLEALLNRPVKIANDANCFVLSEATDGAAQNARSVFGVILGTGVGGGFVLNGQIMTGHQGNAGEWGHNPLPWPHTDELPGSPCYCGLSGCIETYLSGPALSREIHEHGFPEINANQYEQLPAALQDKLLSQYENRLARALAHLINILDPEVIVLGGGLSNIDRIYENVPKIWDKWIFSDQSAAKLLKAKFGDSSGVRGAARL